MDDWYARRGKLARMSRREVSERIESSDGALAGFELTEGGRGPWVWVLPICAHTYRPYGPNVSHCVKLRKCSEVDIAFISELIRFGEAVLRVVYVREVGASRFAVLRLD